MATFTLVIRLEDFGGKPTKDVTFEVTPYDRHAAAVDGVVFIDPSVGKTDSAGVLELEIESVSEAVWAVRSPGRGRWIFNDPGAGVRVALADVLRMPEDCTPSEASEIIKALASFAYAKDVTFDPTTSTLTFEMSNGQAFDVELDLAGDELSGTMNAIETESQRAQAAESALRSDLTGALDAHVSSKTPHPAYDDMVDLTLLYRASSK